MAINREPYWASYSSARRMKTRYMLTRPRSQKSKSDTSGHILFNIPTRGGIHIPYFASCVSDIRLHRRVLVLFSSYPHNVSLFEACNYVNRPLTSRVNRALFLTKMWLSRKDKEARLEKYQKIFTPSIECYKHKQKKKTILILKIALSLKCQILKWDYVALNKLAYTKNFI